MKLSGRHYAIIILTLITALLHLPPRSTNNFFRMVPIRSSF